jgi:hypothetical protein
LVARDVDMKFYGRHYGIGLDTETGRIIGYF